MAITLSVAARNAAVDAVTGRLHDVAGAPLLRLYTGAKPASPDSAATGTLLAEIALDSTTAFLAASDGAAALKVSPEITGTGAAAGDAGWARFSTSAGTGVIDATCGASGSGADVILSSVTVSVGLPLTVASFSYAQP